MFELTAITAGLAMDPECNSVSLASRVPLKLTSTKDIHPDQEEDPEHEGVAVSLFALPQMVTEAFRRIASMRDNWMVAVSSLAVPAILLPAMIPMKLGVAIARAIAMTDTVTISSTKEKPLVRSDVKPL
jgi:hypothetical protein